MNTAQIKLALVFISLAVMISIGMTVFPSVPADPTDALRALLSNLLSSTIALMPLYAILSMIASNRALHA